MGRSWLSLSGQHRVVSGGGGVSHSVSFLLGALLPTLLLLFLASDRLASGISSFGENVGSAHRNLSSAGALAADEKEESFPGLAELLPKVATDDGTVIITSVNEAWAAPGSLLDLFRGSFRDGEGIAHLLNHTLIVAVDLGALAYCQAVHRHCYLLEVTTANVSSANRYYTKSYLEARARVGQALPPAAGPPARLQLSFHRKLATSVSLKLRIFWVVNVSIDCLQDVDILWLRNPFRHISLYADMALSTDYFNDDAEALTNAPNTGFYYAKSTNRTVEMLRSWRTARSRFPPTHDQAIFNEIKSELASGELHIKFVFLETTIFGGFCQLHGEMDKVCTMHANCCIGLENKLHDLRNVVAKWKNYTRETTSEKRNNTYRWMVPTKCEASMRQD